MTKLSAVPILAAIAMITTDTVSPTPRDTLVNTGSPPTPLSQKKQLAPVSVHAYLPFGLIQLMSGDATALAAL